MEKFDIKKEYKGIISIEQLIARQIDRINEAGTNKKHEAYEEGVEHLIDMLSEEHENKALEYKKENGVYYDTHPDGKARYRGLFRFIKRLLSDANIVWKKSSYEVGMEEPSTKKTEKEAEFKPDKPKVRDFEKEMEEIDQKFKEMM